jgi:large subunit ribosomal protein L3
MPGRMGGERVTVKNLSIAGVDPENNLLLIRGAVPGPRNGLVMIRRQVGAPR